MDTSAHGLPNLIAELAPALGSLNEHECEQIINSLTLSPQQARIVSLLLQNKADKEIARDMGVRVPTVRTYLTRIFQRTGTTGRVELILRVVACARARRAAASGGKEQ